MRLFIAEKPSLARAIAAALPNPQEKKGSAIYCGDSDVVTWCAGHIMALSAPDAYSKAYANWSLQDLPITPMVWQREVKVPDLFNTIKALLPKATQVIHAGDPDREGQLLIDEVLEALRYQGEILRLLIQDLNPDAVKKALGALKPNKNFQGLSQSAEARGKADWLYGLNMTRLYTLLGRLGGYQDLLSVGRVQTPLLGLIVRRDIAIESFKPAEHFVLIASCMHEQSPFQATWQPPDTLVNEYGLMQNRAYIETLSQNLQGKTAVVSHVEEKQIEDMPPLPYDLAALQVDAAKKHGLSAKDTLSICQTLYETHQLITYPRSDCAYLPKGHLADVQGIMRTIKAYVPDCTPFVDSADVSLRSRAWNDKKITAHHAIIPTTKRANIQLTKDELAIYELIAKRYVAQFFQKSKALQTRVLLTIEGETFEAKGRVTIDAGWRALYLMAQVVQTEDASDEKDDSMMLPKLNLRDVLPLAQVEVKAKKTQAPPRFNDATLIKSMGNISAYVEDAFIKQILKETDGLGTPATQAQIIQTLFDRHYVVKQGKHILSTPIGRALIAMLPSVATTPDLTALWESQLQAIAENELSLDAFLVDINVKLGELVASGKALGRLSIPGVSLNPCPTCGNALLKLKSQKDDRPYWRCSQKDCAQGILSDVNGVPIVKQTAPCPAKGCSGSLVRHTGKKGGYWWSCNQYVKGCKVTADDDNGRPVIKENVTCPDVDCKGHLTRRPSKKSGGYWWGCSAYKDGCKVTMQDDNGKPLMKAA